MKKALSLILVLILSFGLLGCKSIEKLSQAGSDGSADFTEPAVSASPAATAEAPTEAPEITSAPAPSGIPYTTEAPGVTTAPSVTKAPDITPAPVSDPTKGYSDFVSELLSKRYYSVDLDFDGSEDTVYIEEIYLSAYDTQYKVNVTLASIPDKTFTYVVDYCYDFFAWAVDCDPTDSRLEIVFCFGQDSDDWTACAMRVTDNGLAVDTFTTYFEIVPDMMPSFTSNGGFTVCDRTDILGTRSIYANYTVTKNGFYRVSDDYEYPEYEDYDLSVEFKRSLTVKLLNDDMTIGGDYTIAKGEYVTPVRTDCKNYLIIRLKTGRLALAYIEVRPWYEYQDDYGIFINGINQDELAYIMYAD